MTASLGINQRVIPCDQRLSAQNLTVLWFRLANALVCGTKMTGAVYHTHAVVVGTSPNVRLLSRFVPSRGRPAFRTHACAKKRRSARIALVVAARKRQVWHTVSLKKGKKSCLRKLGLSRQQLHSPLQVAWKQTFSAALLAQAAVLLLQKFSVLTQPQQRLLALRPACCVTTQASAAKHAKLFCALTGRLSHLDRRRGLSSAAILRFKEPSHV